VDGLEQLLRDKPDLLLLDVRNPPITGIETILDAMRASSPADGSEPPAVEGHGGDTDGAARPQPGHALTPREHEIMTLIAEGMSNHQIAAQLVISPKTVKNHIRAAYHRMGVYGRRHAVRHWQGLAGDDGPLA
jgi:DNA-binding NarL/FixJ family response regulator